MQIRILLDITHLEGVYLLQYYRLWLTHNLCFAVKDETIVEISCFVLAQRFVLAQMQYKRFVSFKGSTLQGSFVTGPAKMDQVGTNYM